MSPWIERRLTGFDIILRIVAKLMLPALGAIANCFLTRHFVAKNFSVFPDLGLTRLTQLLHFPWKDSVTGFVPNLSPPGRRTHETAI
jgi:hypothetical protein